MTAAKPQPAAAPCQVWRNKYDAEFVVARVGPDADDPTYDVHGMCDGVYDSVRSSDLALGWSCIGIETAHGRVMVGERREHPRWGGAQTVVGVVGSEHVRTVIGGAEADHPASLVASWPLLPPAPVPSKTGPLARLCAHVAHTLGLPIGEVTAEETPRDAMIRVSVPANVTGLRCDEAWESAREMLPLGISLSVKARRDPLGLTWDRVSIDGIECPASALETARAVVAEYAAKHMGARIMPTLPEYGYDISRLLAPGDDPSTPLTIQPVTPDMLGPDGEIRRPAATVLPPCFGCGSAICGCESGSGIAAMPLKPPVADARPDVVETWDGWALP